MKDFNFGLELPLNSVSFGQVSFALLREFYKKGLTPSLFVIQDKVDYSAQSNIDKEFLQWISECRSKATMGHDRKWPIFKLWHLAGSMQSYSEKQALMSFYELDEPTEYELNVAKNNKTIFTSSYSQEVFKDKGVNTEFVPLGFDESNFYETGREYFSDRITFNVVGKFEKRKHHARIIKSWIEKYGNDPKYFLQCSIDNPFLKQEQNVQLRKSLLGGNNVFNVQFMEFLPLNKLYNDFLNSADIVIGMSGGEGWGLPEFHSVALGKHSVILNASSYKDWANDKNSALVYPCGKWPAEDGMFFKKGTLTNQGNIYTFSEQEFIDSCEDAIKRVEANRVNLEGKKLRQEFTYTKTCDKILEILQSI